MGWVWLLIARVSEVVSIEVVLGVLFVLTRVLLIYSAGRLAANLVPASRVAPLMAGLLMALGPYPILGDGTLVEFYWEQSSMFMPLFVLGLALLLEGKPVRFFLLFGIAYLVNPLYGSWAAGFFLLTYLSDPRRSPWRRFVLASPLFIVMVAPIFMGGVGVLSEPTVDMDLWMWVNRLLISPHAFPSTWEQDVFWRFLFFSVLVLVAGRVPSGQESRLRRLTVTWTAMAWFFLVLGFLAATGISRALLVFQPARAAELFYLAGGVAVAAVGGYQWERNPGVTGLVAMVMWFSALSYLLVPEFREYAVVATVVFGVCLTIALLVIQRKVGFDRRRWVVVTCVWLLFATGLTVSASWARRAKHEGGLARAMYRGPDKDMTELAVWAQSNTSIDAVFFHPPVTWEWAQFRYLSKRPVFATWKDASAVLWDPGYAEEWAARFAAFGFRGDLRDRWDLTKPRESKRVRRSLMKHYRELSDDEFRVMTETYRIDFWIAPLNTESVFPEVARVGDFKVLEVR